MTLPGVAMRMSTRDDPPTSLRICQLPVANPPSELRLTLSPYRRSGLSARVRMNAVPLRFQSAGNELPLSSFQYFV